MNMSSSFFDCLSHIAHHTRRYTKGAQVFERSDPVQQVFRLDAGEIRLVRRTIDGGEFILQRATSGSLLAEASLMTGDYHCAAVAAEDSVVSVWSIDPVRARIQTDETTAQALISLLAAEVRNARLHAETLSFRKVSDRLDAWLAWNGEDLPRKGNWCRIAQEINVTQAALYRELARRRT